MRKSRMKRNQEKIFSSLASVISSMPKSLRSSINDINSNTPCYPVPSSLAENKFNYTEANQNPKRRHCNMENQKHWENLTSPSFDFSSETTDRFPSNNEENDTLVSTASGAVLLNGLVELALRSINQILKNQHQNEKPMFVIQSQPRLFALYCVCFLILLANPLLGVSLIM